uniref:Glycosyl hydrolases family 22 (GH22) domain-containing protein n=1 Tax=Ornithorhynchus anatinus TaxID=9258 RepID=A0A6I8N1T8_ORNAN
GGCRRAGQGRTGPDRAGQGRGGQQLPPSLPPLPSLPFPFLQPRGRQVPPSSPCPPPPPPADSPGPRPRCLPQDQAPAPPVPHIAGQERGGFGPAPVPGSANQGHGPGPQPALPRLLPAPLPPPRASSPTPSRGLGGKLSLRPSAPPAEAPRGRGDTGLHCPGNHFQAPPTPSGLRVSRPQRWRGRGGIRHGSMNGDGGAGPLPIWGSGLILTLGLGEPGLCLAFYASGFDTAAVDHNLDGSKDYGIFQLSSSWWCENEETPTQNLCHLDCKDLLNQNLLDDILCVKQVVRQPAGMNAWKDWVDNCKGQDLSLWLKDCDL